MERLRNSWDVLSHVTCCNVLTLVVEPPSNSTKNSEYKTSKHGIVQRWQYWISVRLSTQSRIYLKYSRKTIWRSLFPDLYFRQSRLVLFSVLQSQLPFKTRFFSVLLSTLTPLTCDWPHPPLSTLNRSLSFDLHHHYVTPTLSNCCVRCPCGLKITPIPDQTLTFL